MIGWRIKPTLQKGHGRQSGGGSLPNVWRRCNSGAYQHNMLSPCDDRPLIAAQKGHRPSSFQPPTHSTSGSPAMGESSRELCRYPPMGGLQESIWNGRWIRHTLEEILLRSRTYRLLDSTSRVHKCFALAYKPDLLTPKVSVSPVLRMATHSETID
jgi:hypothetical protein